VVTSLEAKSCRWRYQLCYLDGAQLFFEPHFPHLENGANKSSLLWGLSKLICVELSPQPISGSSVGGVSHYWWLGVSPLQIVAK
jgi:hypothetical protein